MLPDGNYTYCGEDLVMCIIAESLFYARNQYNIVYQLHFNLKQINNRGKQHQNKTCLHKDILY